LERGLDITVRSAGFLGEGRPPPGEVIMAMERRGLDLRNHVSSHVGSVVEKRPDLVLVMDRSHLRLLLDITSQLHSCSFTLREFVRLAQIEGPRRVGEAITKYLDRVRAGRGPLNLREDDIADPMGQRKSAYEECARQIDTLVFSLVEQLYPTW
jgi:protein-tyrosine-phosphatase